MEFAHNYSTHDSSNLILVVDKDPELARMTSNLLKLYGYDTIETSNTCDAQSICQRLPISTIITKNQLPDSKDITYTRRVTINMGEKRFLGIPAKKVPEPNDYSEKINILATLLSVDSYN